VKLKSKWTRGAIAVFVMTFAFLAFGASSCSSQQNQASNRKATNIQTQQQNLTSEAFSQQSKNDPYPAAQLHNSLERENLIKRLLEFNKRDKIGYVYILSFGKFIGYYTIRGKVSANASQLTNPTNIVKYTCPGSCDDTAGPIEAPGDDGSYGQSEPGIFFFTTTGALIQTDSNYIYSDQPITAGNIPELTK